MNCLEIRNELQRLLDGEGTPRPPGFQEHLSACMDCRDRHRAALRLLEGVRGATVPFLPADFARNVVVQALADRQRARVRTRRRLYLTGALAASILVMVFAGEFWLPATRTTDPGQKEGGPLAPGPMAKVEPAPKEIEPEPLPPLADAVGEAGQAVNSLTERLASEARNHAAQILAAANPMEVAAVAKLPGPFEPPLEPAADSLRQATQGMSEGLEPLTRSAQRAFAFLAREVPAFDTNPDE